MPIPELPFQHPLLHTPAIWHPNAPRTDWVRVQFRRRFTLDSPIARARLWFSGSMRVELFLDEKLLSRGPSRSDPLRWHAVPVELGDLSAGLHELSAKVAHFGAHPKTACAQMGPPAFFLCCGERELAVIVDTGDGWEAQHDPTFDSTGRSALTGTSGYFPMGHGEQIHLAADEQPWVPAKVLAKEPADLWGNLPLKARFRAEPLPAMVEESRLWARLARAPAELQPAAERWAKGTDKLTIPASRQVQLVLDAGTLINAWPHLTLEGGREAQIEAVWAEAPYKEPKVKAHRDQVEGCFFPGFGDVIHGPGRLRSWSPAWLRSFRYLCLNITTHGEPLVLEPVTLSESSFPMSPPADLQLEGASAEDWRRVFDASWQTIRACAHENIWDCPHWEQCQFSGDARFQALWHYALCGEDRLGRKALDDFHASRLPDGMLQCRWPSNMDQILPTYAIHWVLMLEEFLQWRGEPDFLRDYLHGARQAVSWFLNRQRADGLLGRIEHAPFVDWAPAFRPYGNAPQDADGGSAILTAMTAQACAALARLESACGWSELAPRWQNHHARLVCALQERCWVAGRGLIAETPAATAFSVHTQIEAASAGVLDGKEALAVIDRAVGAEGVSQPGTFFYHGQLLMAQRRLGAGGRIHGRIGEWVECLKRTGLKTLPETLAENSRSDCHAWSAAPGFELATAVFGLEPAAAAIGANVLVWRPHLGALNRASVTLPHPKGCVGVELVRTSDGVTGRIDCPVPVVVHGEKLEAGKHAVRWEHES